MKGMAKKKTKTSFTKNFNACVKYFLTTVPPFFTPCAFAALSAQATDTETRKMEEAWHLTGIQTGSESETVIESWTETESEIETGKETETGAGTGRGTETVNVIEKGTETEVEKETGTEVEKGTGIGTGNGSETETEMDHSEVSNQ